ncbi:hypothetical protein IRZ71_10235 [Flavobacterium sp. ANB]|uniref:hypothetical protein n=1 Tax=unclassified Flavobacterium TaxID=196869 RepID=UPI0012B73DD4|nr:MULTISPECIES: hypothetical protein [unclassified Flavobacterium]MBF4516726.1 hypothetical protein [Flavobacterium sp. ANB]MTD69378.1 hypothetical protein [Flavobacterium sp. LC2016-13]
MIKNENESGHFDRSIFVIYEKSELIEFLKLEKKETNVMVCFFNKQLHNSLLLLDEIKNLKIIDASQSRTEIFKDLKLYFNNTSDYVAKIPEIKFSKKSLYQSPFDNFQKALFFYDVV